MIIVTTAGFDGEAIMLWQLTWLGGPGTRRRFIKSDKTVAPRFGLIGRPSDVLKFPPASLSGSHVQVVRSPWPWPWLTELPIEIKSEGQVGLACPAAAAAVAWVTELERPYIWNSEGQAEVWYHLWIQIFPRPRYHIYYDITKLWYHSSK